MHIYGNAAMVFKWFLAIFIITMLNLMDAITYGQLIFPIQDPFFQKFKLDGISLYLLTTSMAQFIYPIFSSFYSGVTTCMMIENIPFLHVISFKVLYSYSTGKSNLNINPMELEGEIMSTILMAFIVSNLITSLFFFSLAWLDLDKIIHQFPRYVLIGSLGGIGAFLMITGFETAIGEKLNLINISKLFEKSTFPLWSIGFGSALIILIIERRMKFPFLAPIFSIILLITFYLVVLIFYHGNGLDALRKAGWLFNGPSEPSFIINRLRIYKYLLPNTISNGNGINWKIIIRLIPTMISATLFGLVHIPINIPSFSRSTGQPFFMKRELISHGISNFATSFIGLLPNYFVYTNSLLFIRAGASSRIPSLLLSACTMIILFYGIWLLRFIPTVIVMFLIFYLGSELLREALFGIFDYTRKREYFTILSIITSMISFGFLEGLLLGLFMAGIIVILDACKLIVVDIPHSTKDSSLHYCISEEAFLQVMRNDCKIINFPDYSFFGNSLKIFEEIRTSAENHDFLILNFTSYIKVDMNIVEGILAMLREYPLSNITTILSCTPLIIKRHIESNRKDWININLHLETNLQDAIRFVDEQLLNLQTDFINTGDSISSSLITVTKDDVIVMEGGGEGAVIGREGIGETKWKEEKPFINEKINNQINTNISLNQNNDIERVELLENIFYHSNKFINLAKGNYKQAKGKEIQIQKIMNSLISQSGECLKTQTVKRGNYLWRRNETVDHFFYLIHGRLLMRESSSLTLSPLPVNSFNTLSLVMEGPLMTKTFLNGTFVINWRDLYSKIHQSSCLTVTNCTVIPLSVMTVKSLVKTIVNDSELQAYLYNLICIR